MCLVSEKCNCQTLLFCTALAISTLTRLSWRICLFENHQTIMFKGKKKIHTLQKKNYGVKGSKNLSLSFYINQILNSSCHGNQERARGGGGISIQTYFTQRCRESLYSKTVFYLFLLFDAPRPNWHAWQDNTQTCLTLPRQGRAFSALCWLCAVVNSCCSYALQKKCSWRKAVKAKLFARSLLHWRCSLQVLARSTHSLFALHPFIQLLSLNFTPSLYPYFYYSPVFAPFHCLSVLSIPLIPSSPPRWGGLALAWLFHSLLIHPPALPPHTPSLPCHLICTLIELEHLNG